MEDEWQTRGYQSKNVRQAMRSIARRRRRLLKVLSGVDLLTLSAPLFTVDWTVLALHKLHR